ncbi:MAG: hypothetical protein K2X47_10295 [Bdellovibrionales bacterium]|nr:hypothetical protein [Bdellovibrionales bacterium]
MPKWLFALVTLLNSTSVLASHPHQAVCLAKGTYQDGTSVGFLVQVSSTRTYHSGNPNDDVYNYDFEARICDDDNKYGQCSTYRTGAPSNSPMEKVTLRGMKNSRKILFEGTISGMSMIGLLVKTEFIGGALLRKMVPFEAKLTCLPQTWVPLKPEDSSNVY